MGTPSWPATITDRGVQFGSGTSDTYLDSHNQAVTSFVFLGPGTQTYSVQF
jgi:hypothetical protein